MPVPDPPARLGRHRGLSYALFLPEEPARGGVVILHGAGSAKESHFDFARAARAAGLAAVAFDQRGHGESEGALDARMLDDVAAMAGLLPEGPLALRGSSMGGYIALLAAGQLDADAVVAICPAGADHLLRGLRAGRFEFDADASSLEAFLVEHDLMAAVAFDQRGHGESEGALDARLLDDVAAMAELLDSVHEGPLALRGSSMGGYVALLAAGHLDADAVVAICPAGSDHLLRGLRSGRFEFDADASALEAFLTEHDLMTAVEQLRTPMLLLHAEGDEQIPVDHSAALHRAGGMEHKRFLALPGGHHRSIQHDAELQGESLRFIEKAFAAS